MFKKMSVCRLMISCPSDVETEVEIINRVVEHINDSIGISMDVFVKTLYWSKNVTPEAGEYPQSIINKQILDKSDAIIAIFSNKIGSSTQHYESGTIEEIELMIQQKKQVFVYFSDKPIRKSEIDMKAEKKIQAFKNKYKSEGFYVDYSSDEEFRENVDRNLTRYITAELSKEANCVDWHTRFENSISQRKEVNLIYDYTRFNEIKTVVSCTNPNVMKIETYKRGFVMDIDIVGIGNVEPQDFAMALFEYVPYDNWSGFFMAEYFFEFDAISSGDVRGVQLEIKDDSRNKIIDKYLKVGNMEQHFQIYLPSITRDYTAWRKISQICFTVFFDNNYIQGEKGGLSVRNLKMVPK